MKRIVISVITVFGVAGSFGCAKTATKTPTGTDTSDAAVESKVGSEADCAPEALRTAALSDGTQVMAGVTETETITIAALLEDPDSYKEQTVQIEGKITEVCSKAGCFVALTDGDGHAVNLKVTDGEVDFRKLAVAGQYAVGEGKFMPRGPHGSQVFITGARISKTVCN